MPTRAPRENVFSNEYICLVYDNINEVEKLSQFILGPHILVLSIIQDLSEV